MGNKHKPSSKLVSMPTTRVILHTYDTADFGFNGVGEPDIAPGNLPVYYILPSQTLEIKHAGIFWPAPEEALSPLAEFPSSDHRLVRIDVEVMAASPAPSSSSAPSVIGFPKIAAEAIEGAILLAVL